MNPLGELLSVDDIRLDVDVADRAELLDLVATMLAVKSGTPRDAVLASLTTREGLGSTGVGHGVAIPHARMSQCVQAAVALVRTRVPIAYDAPDRKPVAIFVGLIVPHRANERHLQLLAAAAAMLGDREFRRRIMAEPLPGTLRELVETWSEAPPPERTGPASS